MFVYRIEHKNTKIGPYQFDYNLNMPVGYAFYDELGHCERHPTPWEEGLELIPSYHCGFASKAQLQEWFEEHHVSYFEQKEYYVYRYVIDSKYVEVADKQCIFKRDCALIRFKTTYH